MIQDKSLRQMYIILVLLLGTLIFIAPVALSQTVGPAANYRNVSVATQLNITNSFPEILTIAMDTNMVLSAGISRIINCNVTVKDFDGGSTVQYVNATFFDSNVASYTSADDNNDHYTNSSCNQTSSGGFTTNYTCSFDVFYYANNGSAWNCTVFAVDDNNATANRSNQTELAILLAINITDIVDFGNLAVTQISNATVANITNFGNVEVNVTVRAYGAEENDNLSMNCTQNNISIDEERFSTNSSLSWASMTPVADNSQGIPNVTLVQRTNDAAGGEVVNSTYWRIRVPAATNPAGQCNGTLIFQAEQA